MEERSKLDKTEFDKPTAYNEISGRSIKELNILESNLQTSLGKIISLEKVKPEQLPVEKVLTPEQQQARALYEGKLQQNAIDRVLKLMEERSKLDKTEFD